MNFLNDKVRIFTFIICIYLIHHYTIGLLYLVLLLFYRQLHLHVSGFYLSLRVPIDMVYKIGHAPTYTDTYNGSKQHAYQGTFFNFSHSLFEFGIIVHKMTYTLFLIRGGDFDAKQDLCHFPKIF